MSAAVAAGHQVTAVTRSDTAAHAMRNAGATPLPGTAETVSEWVRGAAGADVLIDLTRPPLPSRIIVRGARAVAAARITTSRACATRSPP